jgi:hypothetical protein
MLKRKQLPLLYLSQRHSSLWKITIIIVLFATKMSNKLTLTSYMFKLHIKMSHDFSLTCQPLIRINFMDKKKLMNVMEYSSMMLFKKIIYKKLNILILNAQNFIYFHKNLQLLPSSLFKSTHSHFLRILRKIDNVINMYFLCITITKLSLAKMCIYNCLFIFQCKVLIIIRVMFGRK